MMFLKRAKNHIVKAGFFGGLMFAVTLSPGLPFTENGAAQAFSFSPSISSGARTAANATANNALENVHYRGQRRFDRRHDYRRYNRYSRSYRHYRPRYSNRFYVRRHHGFAYRGYARDFRRFRHF
ncbi:MAG: hypothetical protein H2045_10435 [Rhizobiales bacterium]|nr:hypothetical protein [Hyphomicrobiales bacterium]